VRLFVAVEIDHSVREALGAFSAVLRRKAQTLAPSARIGWVALEQLHITLRFIGEVDDDKAAAIAGALLMPLEAEPFDLDAAGAGAFPERGAPRVLWAGVEGGVEGLANLEAEVSRRLAACAIARTPRDCDRPHFSRHVPISGSARRGSRRLHCFRAGPRPRARSTPRCTARR
jgi:2'-5' RNA ligase